MVSRLLSGKGEKADQQLGVQKIPFAVGKPQTLWQGPGPQGLLQRFSGKPSGRFIQNALLDAAGGNPLPRFREKADAQIVDPGQIVKQHTVGAVRAMLKGNSKYHLFHRNQRQSITLQKPSRFPGRL